MSAAIAAVYDQSEYALYSSNQSMSNEFKTECYCQLSKQGKKYRYTLSIIYYIGNVVRKNFPSLQSYNI